MDPALMALCLEVVQGNVDSERFAWLLIETGVKIDSFEWEIANRLLEKQDTLGALAKIWGDTIH